MLFSMPSLELPGILGIALASFIAGAAVATYVVDLKLKRERRSAAGQLDSLKLAAKD